jgi:hypothetical protein
MTTKSSAQLNQSIFLTNDRRMPAIDEIEVVPLSDLSFAL